MSREMTAQDLHEWIDMEDAIVTIQECDRGEGVPISRITQELGADWYGIRDAVRSLLRTGYVERSGRIGRYRLTLLGRLRLGA